MGMGTDGDSSWAGLWDQGPEVVDLNGLRLRVALLTGFALWGVVALQRGIDRHAGLQPV